MRVVRALESLALNQALRSVCVELRSFLLHILSYIKQVEIAIDIGQVLNDLRRINLYLNILSVITVVVLPIKGPDLNTEKLGACSSDCLHMISKTFWQVFIFKVYLVVLLRPHDILTLLIKLVDLFV